ncbi:AAA family ATPase [Pseudoalteromonas sp. SR45-6]|uniref:AAA family ATPase n=1 Tax=Pseudoalteromonas sp. SR45-6 TaxID=2760927 RepID=UPI00160375D8|nr:AAA family ATPase [Pseudoalteromonas sp. SR45-6]MBB1344255.1 AAA family ATPase [Pseudoalteromonas sp. SR45-6]
MDVTIENCNNIDKAELRISDGKLNIKFAPNGTGKSTIAKAITLKVEGGELNQLMPFKYREENPTECFPSIEIVPDIGSVLCFNEDYVRQFTFQSDELVSNSFDIFIRTEAYIIAEQEIKGIVQEINSLFDGNADLESLISNLSELSSAFTLTKKGLSQSSKGMKGLSQGNKVQHIPEGLEDYQPFISSEHNIKWIGWQTQGANQFMDVADCCPFCTSDTEVHRAKIEKVSQEYDKNIINNLISIISVIDRLGDYFTDESKAMLDVITSLPGGVEAEHIEFLKTIKTRIDLLLERLEKLKKLNGFDFKQGEQVREKLSGYKIDLIFLPELNSPQTNEQINAINVSIDEVIGRAGHLQGKLNQQRAGMQRLIEKYQSDINNFLAYAGYKYEVQIIGEDDSSQLKLRHRDHAEFVVGGDQHLSFGEKNAFAIVLFMYECLAKKPDLIVLDDPISSFDKNKKYAILEMLFRRKASNCLKSKTVLMLTHDVEPIIDTVKSVSNQFDNQVAASYMRLSKGKISEILIKKGDIKTFSQICTDFLATDAQIITKVIYLRRYYEIIDNKGDAYQVLSNLLHKRECAISIDSRLEGNTLMLNEAINAGIADICNKIANFNYDHVLAQLNEAIVLNAIYHESSNGYEKLQLFRLFEIEVENSVIQKFINETYHIENEYICQLDPTQFDLIPEYVIDACDQCLVSAVN